MTLEYHLPRLGKISARLYDYAQEAYKLLGNYGHIQKLRDIDQLGVIKNVYEGAHHSRWEYVILQLYLIDKVNTIKDESDIRVARGLGLNSSIGFLGNKVTGADILQIWALLFNVGHLPGTFATERAILRYCKKDKEFKKLLYRGLPQKDIVRKYFINILDKEYIYAFHFALAHFFIERCRRYKSEIPDFIDFLHEVISFYYFNNNQHLEKQRRMKEIYRRVRKISYLYLDSIYCPVPVNFDLSAIFFNLSYYVPRLFKELTSPINRTLDSFENFLSFNTYHSANSIREIGYHSSQVIRMLEKDNRDNEFNKITYLYKYLHEYNKFHPKRKEWGDSINIHMLFELNYSPLRKVFLKYLSFDTEEKWSNKYDKNSCMLTFQPGYNPKHTAITLSFLPKSKINKTIKIIAQFLRDIIKLESNIKKGPGKFRFYIHRIDDTFQQPYRELTFSILKYITEEEFYFEFKRDRENILGFDMFSTIGAKNAADKLKSLNRNSDLTGSRLYEIKALCNSLLKLPHPSPLLVSLSQILVYDSSGKQLTDLDGFALGVKNRELGILLVEAKDQQRGGRGASKRHIENTIDKLKFKTTHTPRITEIAGGAYCYLIIDGL